MTVKATIETEVRTMEQIIDLLSRRVNILKELGQKNKQDQEKADSLLEVVDLLIEQLKDQDHFGYNERKIQEETRGILPSDPYIAKIQREGE